MKLYFSTLTIVACVALVAYLCKEFERGSG